MADKPGDHVQRLARAYLTEKPGSEVSRILARAVSREIEREEAASIEAADILAHIERQSPPRLVTGMLDGDPVIRAEWDESRPVDGMAGEGNDGK